MNKILNLLAFVALSSSAMAETVVWNGGAADGLFTNAANWGGTAPTDDLSTDIAQLTGGTVELDTDRSVSGLDVDTASTLTGSGMRLTLGNDGLRGTADLTLSNNVTLRIGTVGTYSGDLTIDDAEVEVTTDDQGFLGTGTITLDNGGAIVGEGSHVNMRSTTRIILGSGGGTFVNAHARAFYGLENAVISGEGQLTLDGGGSASYSGNSRIQMGGTANTYTGGTLIQNKANVQVSGDGSLGAAGTKVTIDDARLVTVNGIDFGAREFAIGSGGGRISLNNRASTIGGLITGTGALTIDGQQRDDDGDSPGGTLTISNTGNTYSGGTLIDGVVVKGSSGGNVFGSGAVTLNNGGEITGNGNHVNLTGLTSIVLESGGGTLRHAAGYAFYGLDNVVISGDGQLTVAGSGSGSTGGNNRVQMTGTNTYTGGTLLTDNVNLIIYGGSAGDGTLGLAGTKVTFDNGRLMSANNGLNLGTREIAIASGGGRISLNGLSTTIGGIISGTGDFLIDGQNRNIDKTLGGTLRITSAGTHSGDVTINGVDIQMDASNAFGTGAIALDNGAQLKNRDSHTTLDNAVAIGSGGAELMAGWNKSLTLGGTLSGSGDLIIVGDSGTVLLSGTANTFSGNIDLQDSTSKLSLASLGDGATISGVDGASLTFTGDILVMGANTFAGTTLVGSTGAIGGSGSLAGALTLDAGAGFVFSETDSLTVAGLVTLDDSFSIEDLIGLSSSTADGTYTLIETVSTFDHIQNFGIENAFDLGDGKSAYFGNGSLQVTVIPEPSSLGLMVVLSGGIFFLRRRFMF
ncbi:MAG: PEP-CTERM sorting domain-containing protein [Pontiella sp.]